MIQARSDVSSNRLAPLLRFMAVLYCAITVWKLFSQPERYQWDLRAYYYGACAFASGLNPYSLDDLTRVAGTPIDFIYPYSPITLWFFNPLTVMSFRAAYVTYLLLKIGATIALVFWWKRAFLSGKAGTLYYFFCIYGFNMALYRDLRAGNISLFEQILLWTALYYFMRHKYMQFCLLLVSCSIFKITPMFFLCLLLLTQDRRRYLHFTCSVLLFGAIMAASYFVDSQLLAQFLGSAVCHLLGMQSIGGIAVINPCLNEGGPINQSFLAAIREGGQALCGRIGVVMPWAGQMALFLIIAGAVLTVSLRVVQALKASTVETQGLMTVLFACVTYVLVLPRLKDYGLIVLLVPTWYILSEERYSKLFVPFALFAMTPLWSYHSLSVAFCVWLLYVNSILRPVSTQTVPPSSCPLQMYAETG